MATFDRILGDILDFTRRFLWWKQSAESVKRKPFQTIQKPIQGGTGIISLVMGRDTPRAVRTWIFSPYHHLGGSVAKVKEPLNDIHIYLDFLGPLANAPETQKTNWSLSLRKAKERGEAFLTHRIQILKASHMLNASGFYDYELLFWQDYDFYRPGAGDPERWAVMAVDKLAHHLTATTEVAWEKEIAEIRQVVLGHHQPRTAPRRTAAI